MTTSTARDPAVPALQKAGAHPAPRRLPLLDQYLREQQDLSAVERFAQRQVAPSSPTQERYYRDLLPTTTPAQGEQYAFAVNLDLCTGCKACVTACHNLNGLDDGETWRAVGLVQGGTAAKPVRLSVTSACHHCLDPACMNGCPVGAYEKDALTGIVKHLDDQCIGCQYCTFTCPYDVPQYSASRGIVRKCDMCTGRLEAGEAPSCVEACPSEAIAITIVKAARAREHAPTSAVLLGGTARGTTVPTTVYTTARVLPQNLAPAHVPAAKPSTEHAPLVAMLVLNQLSVGAFCVDAIARHFGDAGLLGPLGRLHALAASAVAIAALAIRVLHLGRPRYAFRALVGLRTSWMSREILACALFTLLALAYAAAALGEAQLAALLSEGTAARIKDTLRLLVAAMGLGTVSCSVLVYHLTRRALWTAPATGFKFFLTAALLGLATATSTFSLAAALAPDAASSAGVASLLSALSRILVAATVTKLLGELAFFFHLRDERPTDSKHAAVLMVRDLGNYTAARFILLGFGGVVFPLLNWSAPVSAAAAGASLALLLGGELLERTLFFAAASSPGAPGGLR